MGRNTIDQQHALYDSPIDVVANTLVIPKIDKNLEKHYIGVRYYSAADGTPVTPTGGTVAIQALDEVTNQWTASASTLTCTDVTDKETISANVTSIRAVPTSILTATHWQLFSSSNL